MAEMTRERLDELRRWLGCGDTSDEDTSDLLDAVEELVWALEDAQSGYIPGSGPDIKWTARRDALLSRYRRNGNG